MKTKITLAFVLLSALVIAAFSTENNIVKFGASNSLTDSGIVQPSTGNYEFGPMDWGTVILRIPPNTSTVGNGNGTHLMILAGFPGQAVGMDGNANSSGGSITIKGANGVGTNGYGGSVSIYGGLATGTGQNGWIWLESVERVFANAPVTELTGYLQIDSTALQIDFGATASAPADKNHVATWVAVSIAGDTNSYRLPLYR